MAWPEQMIAGKYQEHRFKTNCVTLSGITYSPIKSYVMKAFCFVYFIFPMVVLGQQTDFPLGIKRQPDLNFPAGVKQQPDTTFKVIRVQENEKKGGPAYLING
ncbi:hypothetical protein [Parapedobacter sp. DT-150]|uniref:hypothetical protein n=1 Tax=Parapedobacter sp. DT-150 TaxID=3396162 RepID=UPI003F542464